MTMTKSKLQAIAADMEKALAEVSKKHGVTIKRGSGRFDPSAGTAELKMMIATNGENGEAETVEMKKLKANYPEIANKEVKIGGRTFQIVGYKPSSYKFPFIGKDLNDEKMYKLASRDVGIKSFQDVLDDLPDYGN